MWGHDHKSLEQCPILLIARLLISASSPHVNRRELAAMDFDTTARKDCNTLRTLQPKVPQQQGWNCTTKTAKIINRMNWSHISETRHMWHAKDPNSFTQKSKIDFFKSARQEITLNKHTKRKIHLAQETPTVPLHIDREKMSFHKDIPIIRYST